ncbi:MAG: hypothetical protein AB7S38_07890 [Vulcanimicrobiota bacterium]
MLKVAIIVVSWLVVIGAGLAWLDQVAANLEKLPVYRYSQVVWSSDESKLAFVRTTLEPPRTTGRRELWYAKRVGDEAQMVSALDSPLVEVLSWVADDSALLTLTEGTGPVPELALLWLDGRKQVLEFARPNLRYLGVEGGRIYFVQRHADLPWEPPSSERADQDSPANIQEMEAGAPRTTLTRRGLEILSWAPGEKGFRKHLTIPYSPPDQLRVESVTPSPDHRFLALCVRSGEGGPVGVWIYDSEETRLRWTTIQAPADRSFIAWSPDSVGILAVLDSHFFLLPNVMTTAFHRFSAGGATHYRALWTRERDSFLLQDENAILRLSRENFQAEPVVDQHLLKMEALDLSLSPLGNWAVFRTQDEGQDILQTVSLATLQTKPLLAASSRRLARQSLLYHVAEGTRYARRRWWGGRGSAPGE